MPIRVAPLIVAGGAVAHDESKRSASRVAVYGINDLFGQFHHKPAVGVAGTAVFPSISGRDALVSEAALPQQLARIAPKPAPPEVRRIYLRADKALDYGRVMRVMGELNRAGLNRGALLSVRDEQ